MLGKKSKDKKEAKKEAKKDKKEKKAKKSSKDKKDMKKEAKTVAKKTRDPTGKVFLADMKEWLASRKNSEHIEYVKTEEEEHRFHFTIGDEKLNFEVTFPVGTHPPPIYFKNKI